MITLNPYLNFKGNAEEAFNFYKSVFGGEFSSLQRYKDVSEADPEMQKISQKDMEKIMHISLPIGKGNVLMASDSVEPMGGTLTVGDNFNLSISAENEEEATRIFNALSEGGKVEVPLQKMFWDSFFGMLVDKFGIYWMVNYD